MNQITISIKSFSFALINVKDIGIISLKLALFSGLLVTAFSVLVRRCALFILGYLPGSAGGGGNSLFNQYSDDIRLSRVGKLPGEHSMSGKSIFNIKSGKCYDASRYSYGQS